LFEEKYLVNKLSSSLVDKGNAQYISDYLTAIKSEINPSLNYQKDIIDVLCILSKFTILSPDYHYFPTIPINRI
jgi:hypothetical protein